MYTSENLHQDEPDAMIAGRFGAWKLIAGPGDGVLLYDLERDPGELTSVANEHPEIVSMLKAEFARRAETVEARAVELSADELRLLEALGYAERQVPE